MSQPEPQPQLQPLNSSHHPQPQPSSTETVLNSRTVVDQALAFLSAEKPDTVSTLDVLVTVELILRRATDHAVNDSHLRTAERLKTSLNSVQRSFENLKKLGWVNSRRRPGKSSYVALCWDKLPTRNAQERSIVTISAEAKDLASRYQQVLTRHFKRKKFPKGWLTLQLPSAEDVLRKCGGDAELARQIVGFALRDERFTKRAQRSLYHIRGIWKKVEASYREMQSQRLEQAQAASEAISTPVQAPAQMPVTPPHPTGNSTAVRDERFNNAVANLQRKILEQETEGGRYGTTGTIGMFGNKEVVEHSTKPCAYTGTAATYPMAR